MPPKENGNGLYTHESKDNGRKGGMAVCIYSVKVQHP